MLLSSWTKFLRGHIGKLLQQNCRQNEAIIEHQLDTHIKFAPVKDDVPFARTLQLVCPPVKDDVPFDPLRISFKKVVRPLQNNL